MASARAADMEMFEFGHQSVVRVNQRKGTTDTLGRFAVHVQCPWRIRREDALLVGYEDLFDPASGFEGEDPAGVIGGSRRDERLARYYEKAPLEARLVAGVETSAVGDLRVALSGGDVLEVFAAATNGEHWRLLDLLGGHLVWSAQGPERLPPLPNLEEGYLSFRPLAEAGARPRPDGSAAERGLVWRAPGPPAELPFDAGDPSIVGQSLVSARRWRRDSVALVFDEPSGGRTGASSPAVVSGHGLRVAAPWRLRRGDGLVAAQGDAWEPPPGVDYGDFDRAAPLATLCDVRLADFLESTPPDGRFVMRVARSALGDLRVDLSGGVTFEVFPDRNGPGHELWRLLDFERPHGIAWVTDDADVVLSWLERPPLESGS